MFSQRIATSIDYNRGLPAPVRWVHVGAAAITPVVDALFGWTTLPRCRRWAPLLVFTAIATAVMVPFDGSISQSMRAWLADTGGDVRRELEAIQQFGQGLSMVLIAAVILVLDPARRGRLLDWALAALITLAATNGLKALVGRPRPHLGEPLVMVGPLGAMAVERAARDGGEARVELVTVWSNGYDLASMPSRHAAFAVLAAVFLAMVYPRVKGIVLALAVLVCFGRVATGAHYPTDTLVGAAVGLLVARYVIEGRWGEGLWVWAAERWARGARRGTPAAG